MTASHPRNPVYNPIPAASFTSPMPRPARVSICSTNIATKYPTEPPRVIIQRSENVESAGAVKVVVSKRHAPPRKSRPVHRLGNRCSRISMIHKTTEHIRNQSSAQLNSITVNGEALAEEKCSVSSRVTNDTLANHAPGTLCVAGPVESATRQDP